MPKLIFNPVSSKFDYIATKTDLDLTGTNSGDVTVTDSSTIDFTLTGQALTGSVIQSGLDHGSISGLLDDDHTQYALLDGRSSGQTLTGAVNASGTLTLRSTSNATKGNIQFGTSAYDEVNNRLGLGKNNPSYQLDATGVGAFAGGLRVDADTNTAFDALYFRNSNNGATALNRASFRTDAGETFIIDNFSSGYSGTIGSIPYAGLVRLTARLASSGLMIGTETTAEPFYLGTANTVRATITGAGNVGIGDTAPSAQLHVDQTSTTAAKPTLRLQQADLSEEFIRFDTTVGAGNPINTTALGTYYGRVRVYVEGVGEKWLALYNT